jgi:Cytochrome c7 and related cytochrome c
MIFQPRADQLFRQIFVGSVLILGLLGAAAYCALRPEFTRVGYAPEQPVPFSHELHAGRLGMSCIYCHANVERSPHATVPNTQTCMNCHQTIKANSPLLSPVRESFAKGVPLEWKRVHRLPDYAYFNHAQHVNRGVGCVSCHGRVNEMPVVAHEKPLSMGWCLNCHKHPEGNLRPPEVAANMQWKPPQEGREDFARKMQQQLNVKPPQSCQGCHR